MRLSISPRQLPVVGAGIGVCASLGYVLRRKRIKASQWERTNFHGVTVTPWLAPPWPARSATSPAPPWVG